MYAKADRPFSCALLTGKQACRGWQYVVVRRRNGRSIPLHTDSPKGVVYAQVLPKGCKSKTLRV